MLRLRAGTKFMEVDGFTVAPLPVTGASLLLRLMARSGAAFL
jgi:hypothetical protein